MYGWVRMTRPRDGEDNRRIGLDFDAAASAAPELVHEHDDEIIDMHEPLRGKPTLFPSFGSSASNVFRISERLQRPGPPKGHR